MRLKLGMRKYLIHLGAQTLIVIRFLRDLKESCLKEAGNSEFWQEVQKLGRSLSLISEPEARKLGGRSEFSESASEAVS
jgi:hypothetical protein